MASTKLPAQGPYRFVRYRGEKKLTCEVDNPQTGRRIQVSSTHLLPYAGEIGRLDSPSEDIGKMV